MSIDLPDDDLEGSSRKRAAWVLGVLALVAIIVASIMVLFLGAGSSTHHDALLPATGISPTSGAPGVASGSAATRTASSRSAPSTSPPTAGTATCPTAARCALPGDGGQAGAAINAYRAAHHVPSVPTTVSAIAQACALNSGDGPACSASYFWEPVPALDGAALVAKIAAKSTGAAWLADPTATSFAVGWAYAPTGRQVEGVLFKLG